MKTIIDEELKRVGDVFNIEIKELKKSLKKLTKCSLKAAINLNKFGIAVRQYIKLPRSKKKRIIKKYKKKLGLNYENIDNG